MDDKEWYLAIDGQQSGPHPEGALDGFRADGRLTPETYVWRMGMENWQRAGETELYGGPAAGAPPLGSAAGVVGDGSMRSLPGATFGQAVSRFWKKYVQFSGRASRSEFWWAILFLVAVSIVLGTIDAAIFGIEEDDPGLFSPLFSLATLLPSLAVGARRLHDIDRTAWWLLLWFVPILGWIVLIVFHILPSTPGPNRFGE
ncbi:MAG: DUF805 domain-containing protein [Pseudomonadota bacterium]